MPLTKQQKHEAVEQIAEDLAGANTVYLTDYQGLSVERANALRREFYSANITFKVLKNTLLRRAMDDAEVDFSGLYEYLHGPTAIALSSEPAAPAKVIQKFIKGSEAGLPRLKGAYVDGAFFGPDQLDVLAALKSKDELVAEILGLLLAPIQNVTGALKSPGAALASVIQQIAEKNS